MTDITTPTETNSAPTSEESTVAAFPEKEATPRPFQLHNTLSGKKETFEPSNPNVVTMYACGPTVYDDAHLGHARCYITWDVLYRFLQYQGYTVRYARNITDVDDKILNRAKETDTPFLELATHFTQSFHDDMKALNTLPPTDEPRATDYIDEMLKGIQTLIDNGNAYSTTDGSAYFRVSKNPSYGKLCKQNIADLQSGARVEENTDKESPLDFALWKAVSADDVHPIDTTWQTPWYKANSATSDETTPNPKAGRGRPGWHMECSAMNHKLFGSHIDIHTGGADLIFPHHENEIAQSEAWTGHTPFAKYWLHNGFVNVSGEKMSKSLDNFATIKSILKHYDANTLRYFLLTNHYRIPVDFSEKGLQGAKNRMAKIHRSLKSACDVLAICPDVLAEYPLLLSKDANSDAEYLKSFTRHMLNDLNTPKALADMDRSLSAMNTVVHDPAEDLPKIKHAFHEALSIFAHLGFNSALIFVKDALPDAVVTAIRTLHNELTGEWLKPDRPVEELIDEILAKRVIAKQTKNWKQADAIRKHMTDLGFQVQDSPDGQSTWEHI